MYPYPVLTYTSPFFGFIAIPSGSSLFVETVAMMVSFGFAPACAEKKLVMTMLAATDIVKQRFAAPQRRITFFIFESMRTFLSGPGSYSGLLSQSNTFLRDVSADCDKR